MGQQFCPSTVQHTELELELVAEKYHQFKMRPYGYIIEVIKQLGIQQIEGYEGLLKSVTSLYNNVPYHNVSHAFDVMVTCDRFLVDYSMRDELGLSPDQRVFLLIAAYAHDNGHQGLTNNFYINSQHQLALRYSNISPLQNMHSSNLLNCLRLHNIPITPEQKQLMVSLILATDNKHHFELLRKIQQYQEYLNHKIIDVLSQTPQQKGNNQTNIDKCHKKKYKQTLLEMIIHTADLSPCSKPVSDYLKWNQRLYDEFKVEYYKQRELKLEKCSFNFNLDNEELSFASQNLSFFNKMILPFFKEVSIVIPQFSTELNYALQIRKHFQSKVKSLEDKKQPKKVQSQNSQ